MTRQSSVLAGLLAAAGLLAYAAWWSVTAEQRVIAARDSLNACRDLAGKLIALREAPETTAAAQASEDELAKRFEAWARQSGLGAEQVERIDPKSPRRLGDSDYLVEGEDIELTDVTLKELAVLASAVERSDRRLRVSSLRLVAPRGEADAGRWRVELALTYLRHSPKSRRSG